MMYISTRRRIEWKRSRRSVSLKVRELFAISILRFESSYHHNLLCIHFIELFRLVRIDVLCQLGGRLLQTHDPRLATHQIRPQLPEHAVLLLHQSLIAGQINRFRTLDLVLRLLQPSAQLRYRPMELAVLHQRAVQCRLPAGRPGTDGIPAAVVLLQPLAQLGRPIGIARVRRQMFADNVERLDDALVAVEIEQELAVVLYCVLQRIDVRWWAGELIALRRFRHCEPLLEAPQIVIDLLPVAVRTQRTR